MDGIPTIRAELRAAAEDLRFLEGFLTTIGNQERTSELSVKYARLSRFAARQALEVGQIAHILEEELARWAAEAQEA